MTSPTTISQEADKIYALILELRKVTRDNYSTVRDERTHKLAADLEYRWMRYARMRKEQAGKDGQ